MEISSGDATPRSAHAARAPRRSSPSRPPRCATPPRWIARALAERPIRPRGRPRRRVCPARARVEHAARRARQRREHQDVSREVRRGDGAPELVLVAEPSRRLAAAAPWATNSRNGDDSRVANGARRAGDDGTPSATVARAATIRASSMLRRQLAAPVRVHGRRVRAVPLEVVFRVAGVHLVGARCRPEASARPGLGPCPRALPASGRSSPKRRAQDAGRRVAFAASGSFSHAPGARRAAQFTTRSKPPERSAAAMASRTPRPAWRRPRRGQRKTRSRRAGGSRRTCSRRARVPGVSVAAGSRTDRGSRCRPR